MNWEYVTLDKLGDVSRGRSKHRPRNDASLFGGDYPFIQTADVKDAPFYITSYSDTYNEKGLSQSKLWNKGTLCITIAANIADTAILGIDACFPDSVMGFIPHKGVSDVRFVKYAFDMLQRDMRQISQGTAQDNLSWQKLSTIMFPKPPIDIQERIADVLAAYEDLIENNQKQIKLLEEAAQRLYKEWFVNLRFPGHEDTVLLNDLPIGWKKIRLGDLDCKLEAGTRPKGGVGDITVGVPSIGAENVIGLGKYNYSSEKLISREFFSAVNEHVFLLHTENEDLQYYLFFTLYQHEYFIKMQKLNKNSAQPGINSKSMMSLELTIPDERLIFQFNQLIFPLMRQLFNKAKQNHYLIEARDRLLPKLMSGEIEL